MVLAFLREVVKLKEIPRSGWIPHGIRLQDAESVAEHSFTSSIIALLIAQSLKEEGKSIDVEKALKMALLHDVSEALTFDISKQYLEYLGAEGEKVKASLERRASTHVIGKLTDKDLASSFQDLIAEFMEGNSLEARAVREADAIDILIQITEYWRKGYPRSLLDPLWHEVMGRLRGSEIRLVRSLLKDLSNIGRGGRARRGSALMRTRH